MIEGYGFGSIHLTNGSGSGSRRPKIIWILFILLLILPPLCNAGDPSAPDAVCLTQNRAAAQRSGPPGQLDHAGGGAAGGRRRRRPPTQPGGARHTLRRRAGEYRRPRPSGGPHHTGGGCFGSGIHLIHIRIQHFRLNTDPDPRSQRL
jgi:hypothetical protein